MQSADNNQVNQEVERLLATLRKENSAQYDIVITLIGEMYNDPKQDQPEGLTRAIEDKIYRLIDDQAKYS